MKKWLSLLLGILMLLSLLPVGAVAQEASEPEALLGEPVAVPVENAEETDAFTTFFKGQKALSTASDRPLLASPSYSDRSGQSSVNKLSPSELRSLYKQAFTFSASSIYKTAPKLSTGYAPSVLSNDAYAHALAIINYYRTVAGIAPITFTDAANKDAAWGALVMAMNDELTHYPSQPSGMSNTDYKKGSNATGSSNISYSGGYSASQVLKVAINGQMADSSASNYDILGHRRWLLDPRTVNMGIGSANNGSSYYTDVKVFGDDVGTKTCNDYDFISWPASGNNILESFQASKNASDITSWSVVLNPNKYQAPQQSKVSVTLTCKATGENWVINKDSNPSKSFLYVDNDGYGVSNCICFHPFAVMDYGDYTVEITGIYDKSGSPTTISYTTTFISPNEPSTGSGQWIETTSTEIENKLDNNDSFVVMFDSPTCGYSSYFTSKLNSWLAETGIDIYRVDADPYGIPYEVYNALGRYSIAIPAFAFIENGTLYAYDAYDYYTSKETLSQYEEEIMARFDAFEAFMKAQGSYDSTDLTALARHLAKVELITDAGALKLADVNKDGKISAADLTAMAALI